MLLGLAYRIEGKPELLGEAVAELRQALALNPDIGLARLSLARIYLDMARPGRARDELTDRARAPPQPAAGARAAGRGGTAARQHGACDRAGPAGTGRRIRRGRPGKVTPRPRADRRRPACRRRSRSCSRSCSRASTPPKRISASAAPILRPANPRRRSASCARRSVSIPHAPEAHVWLARAYRRQRAARRGGQISPRPRPRRRRSPRSTPSAGGVHLEEGLVRLRAGTARRRRRGLRESAGPRRGRTRPRGTSSRRSPGCRQQRPAGEDNGEGQVRCRRWLAQMLIIAAASLILTGWLPESFRLKAEAARATGNNGGSHEGAGTVPRRRLTRFADVTAKAGIGFVHKSGASPDKYMVETFGSGVAWIDYDNDGFPDLYFVNGAPGAPNALYHNNQRRHLHGRDRSAPASPAPAQPRLQDRRRRRRLRQRRLSRSLRHRVRPEHAYRNNGDGTFTDVTAAAGVAGGADRVEHQHRVLRLRPRRLPRSLRRQLPRLPARRQPVLRLTPATATGCTAIRRCSTAWPTGCSATTATARSPTSRSRPASPIRRARGSA